MESFPTVSVLFSRSLSTKTPPPFFLKKLYIRMNRTFGPGTADSAVANASQPTISEIS